MMNSLSLLLIFLDSINLPVRSYIEKIVYGELSGNLYVQYKSPDVGFGYMKNSECETRSTVVSSLTRNLFSGSGITIHSGNVRLNAKRSNDCAFSQDLTQYEQSVSTAIAVTLLVSEVSVCNLIHPSTA